MGQRVMILIFLATVAVHFGSALAQTRECTWSYKNSCYYLVEHAEEFFAAETECAIKYGGHLVSLGSIDEINFITVQILNKYGCAASYLWSGGFQDGDAEWRWTDSMTNWNATNWDTATNQPDLLVDGCAGFYGGYQWRWFDTACTTKYNFICEVD